MKHRHKMQRASGGRMIDNPPVTDVYAGGNSEVVKSAKERKRGGSVKECAVEGKKSKPHMGRPGRKVGGRIGANKMPLSTAAKITSSAEHRD